MRFGGLIIAIVLAAGAAFFVLKMNTNEQPPQPQVGQSAPQLKTVNVYVAARPISIGSTITQEMIAIQPWPEHLVLPGFILADGAAGKDPKAPAGAQAVVGTVARGQFQAQEPIIQSKLANPNDPNFLAGELPKGMRVITIVTNETEGLAGFVFPGDRVDVLLTHDVQVGREGHTSTESITETLLNNVTVLAVDQRAAAGAEEKEGKLSPPRSVSIMVSPTDAQRVRLGQKVGTLTLSLRSLADRESADPMTLTSIKEVSQFKSGSTSVSPTVEGEVIIYRGAERANAPSTAPAPAAAAPNSNSSATGQ